MHKIGKELDAVLQLQAMLGSGRDNDRSGIPVPRDALRPAPYNALPVQKKERTVRVRLKRNLDSGELLSE